MNGAAAQVRSIDGTLRGLVEQLVSAGVWSGSDADRFASEWNDLVHGALIAAAGSIDAVSFEPLA